EDLAVVPGGGEEDGLAADDVEGVVGLGAGAVEWLAEVVVADGADLADVGGVEAADLGAVPAVPRPERLPDEAGVGAAGVAEGGADGAVDPGEVGAGVVGASPSEAV